MHMVSIKNYNLFFQKIKNQSEEEREKKLIIWIMSKKVLNWNIYNKVKKTRKTVIDADL